MNAKQPKLGRPCLGLAAFVLLGSAAISACTSTSAVTDLNTVDRAQASSENISSLTAVVNRNSQDPEAYNVRGSAYGKGGRYREALADFDRAIQLRVQFVDQHLAQHRAASLAQRVMGGRERGIDRHDILIDPV